VRARAILPVVLLLIVSGCGRPSVPESPSVVALGGVVTLEDDTPLGGATVWVWRDGLPVGRALCDGDGRFGTVVPGGRRLEVLAVRHVAERDEHGAVNRRFTVASPRVSTPGGTHDLRLTAGTVSMAARKVSLRVSSLAGPVANADLSFWLPRVSSEEHSFLPTSTNESGSEEVWLEGVQGQEPPWILIEPRETWAPARARVPLEASEVTFVLARLREVKGRLVASDGSPVAGVGVLPVHEDATGALGWGDLTAPDGEFRIRVPDTWDVAALHVGGLDPVPEAAASAIVAFPLGREGTEEPREVRLPFGWQPLRVPSPPPGDDGGRDADARRVCEVVLRSEYLDGPKIRVVADPFPGCWDLLTPVPQGKPLPAPTTPADFAFADFLKRSTSSHPAPRDLGLPLLVLPNSWLGHGLGFEEFWPRFHERFPHSGGLLEISAVGFDPERTHAVVQIHATSGELSGSGYRYRLEKRDGDWVIAERELVWMS
jgi:hypothetical protein